MRGARPGLPGCCSGRRPRAAGTLSAGVGWSRAFGRESKPVISIADLKRTRHVDGLRDPQKNRPSLRDVGAQGERPGSSPRRAVTVEIAVMQHAEIRPPPPRAARPRPPPPRRAPFDANLRRRARSRRRDPRELRVPDRALAAAPSQREHDSRIAAGASIAPAPPPTPARYHAAPPRSIARNSCPIQFLPPRRRRAEKTEGIARTRLPERGVGRNLVRFAPCFLGRFRLSRSARDPWRPGPQPRRRPWPPAGGRATRGERRAHRPASSSSFTSARWASIASSSPSVQSTDDLPELAAPLGSARRGRELAALQNRSCARSWIAICATSTPRAGPGTR